MGPLDVVFKFILGSFGAPVIFFFENTISKRYGFDSLSTKLFIRALCNTYPHKKYSLNFEILN